MARRAFPLASGPLRAVISLLLSVSFATPWILAMIPPAAAAPVLLSARRSAPAVAVAVGGAGRAVPATETVRLDVTVSIAAPSASLTVRARIKRPSGTVLYQRTVTRTGLSAGTVTVRFEKPLAGLDLREGRYPVEIEVSARGLAPVTLRDRLYVVGPGRKPVTVVIVPRFRVVPSTDPEGRFVVDPASSTGSRDKATALVGLLDSVPEARISLAMPPLLLDEWRRIVSGYQTVGPEGLRDVGKNAPVAATYAAALQRLKDAVAEGRMEVLDVPFADPDLAGLRSIGGLADLHDHYDRGASIYQAALGTAPVAGTAVLGDVVPSAAAPILSAEKLSFVLLRPTAVFSKSTTPAAGVYTLADGGLRGVIVDQAGSALIERGASAEEFLDRVFERLTSKSAGQPLVIPVRVGPGSPTDMQRMERILVAAARSGMVRFASATQAARSKAAGALRLKPAPSVGRPAPYGYWSDVSKGRAYALAFVAAVSERDPDASSALYSALVSESRCWAGPDNSWSLADRGRAFASAAARRADSVLSGVSISSQNVTLSRSDGRVPLTVKNESGKTLSVFIVAKGTHTRFPSGSRVRATLRPGDNYVTIPVDLGSGGLFDRLQMAVVAGDVTIAASSLEVRASYLDRLAAVAMVALVLGGMLLYIRRKVRTARADNYNTG